MVDHSPVHHDAVAATCTEDGNDEYWTCSVCHKYFSDAACAYEITADDVVDPATGHSWDYNNPVWGENPVEDLYGDYQTTLTLTCSDCDETRVINVTSTGIVSEEYANCTEGGYKEAHFEKQPSVGTKPILIRPLILQH